MRILRFGVYIALALALVAGAEGAEEADEFDDIAEIQEASAPKTPANTPHRMTAEEAAAMPKPTWTFEYIIGGVAGMYLVNFFLGRKSNRRLANAWLAGAEPVFQKEFAYTAKSADPPIGLLEDSATNFKYYCTGRRYCARMVADLQLASRHDLFIRLLNIVRSNEEYLTFDVGLNPKDLDPIVFTVCKKSWFNDVAKVFPELLALTKRIDSKLIPESMWLNADNSEIPNLALTKQFQQQLKELEPFLEFIHVTDCNNIPIIGLPKTERRHLLRIRFRLFAGSKGLDSNKTAAFMTSLIDAIGSTWKVSRDVKATAQKKRTKWAQEVRANEIKEAARDQPTEEKVDKKREEYKKLSYEEQQKFDEQQKKKQLRKRFHK